jgi:hypothetical protein
LIAGKALPHRRQQKPASRITTVGRASKGVVEGGMDRCTDGTTVGMNDVEGRSGTDSGSVETMNQSHNSINIDKQI